MPTARQVVAGAMPSAVVLAVASPLLLWWLLDTPTGEVRTAAGVTACLRLEAAVAGLATAAALGTALLLPERPWTSFAVVAGVLAAVHVLPARHGRRYLTALHSGDRPGRPPLPERTAAQ